MDAAAAAPIWRFSWRTPSSLTLVLAFQSFLAVLRFALELILVALYATFGFRLGQKLVSGLDWTFGILFPAFLIVMWGTFVSPRAPRRLTDPMLLMLELALFLVGIVLLALRSQAVWGVALFVAFALDRILLDRLGKPAWAEPASGPR